MKQDLQSDLLREFTDLKTDAIYHIAFSGGSDSTALLLLFKELQSRHNLAFDAIHVNHQLHSDAPEWENHCRNLCREFGIDLITKRVDASMYTGHGPEAYARKLRYEVFAGLMKQDEILVTAHTEDDLAETLLLQLLRGSGVEGVAAIPRFRQFATGYIYRPLLGINKNQLENYLRDIKVSWVFDSSNQDSNLDRNYLRAKVMPLLSERWPAITRVFRRSAENFSDTADLLVEIAEMDMDTVLDRDSNCLDLEFLNKLSSARQNNLLRHWLKNNGVTQLSRKLISSIHNEVIAAELDRNPEVRVGNKVITRYRGRIYLIEDKSQPATEKDYYEWDSHQDLDLGFGRLNACMTSGDGIADKYIHNKKLMVCFRKEGERIRLRGRAGTRALKDLFQQAGIPPWERSRTPLIYIDNKLAAVAGHWTSADFIAEKSENGWVFKLEH